MIDKSLLEEVEFNQVSINERFFVNYPGEDLSEFEKVIPRRKAPNVSRFINAVGVGTEHKITIGEDYIVFITK